MKEKSIIRILSCSLFLLWISAVSATPTSYSFSLADGSRLWLEGDSTLHAYESEAEVLNLESEIMTDLNTTDGIDKVALFKSAPDQSLVKSFTLTIPIKDMKSGVAGLSSQLHKTLKYKEFPNIIFHLATYSMSDEEGAMNIKADGNLTLAGQTNTISLSMNTTVSDDYIEVVGEKELLMSDYGVKPPTMMLGAIKTDDKVVIKWDLRVKITPKQEGGQNQ